VKGTEEPAA